MSDADQSGTRAGRTSGVGAILTPEASALAAFTFAVATMTGQGAWTSLAQAFFGTSFSQTQVGSVLASWYVSTMLLDAVAFWLAHRALADPAVGASWAGHLARAAVIVATLAAVVSVIALVATLVRGNA